MSTLPCMMHRHCNKAVLKNIPPFCSTNKLLYSLPLSTALCHPPPQAHMNTGVRVTCWHITSRCPAEVTDVLRNGTRSTLLMKTHTPNCQHFLFFLPVCAALRDDHTWPFTPRPPPPPHTHMLQVVSGRVNLAYPCILQMFIRSNLYVVYNTTPLSTHTPPPTHRHLHLFIPSVVFDTVTPLSTHLS